MMGGAAKIIARGRELYEQGKYLYAQEILNKLVYAEPHNQAARDLLADVFEQIGYQQESTSVRNSFLAGALELRSGIPAGIPPRAGGPDLVRGMPTELWLEYLAIRLDSRKAEGSHFVLNLLTPDNGQQFVVELSNAVLTSIKGQQAANPDLTLTLNRTDLEPVMMGQATFAGQVASGKAKLVGDRQVFDRLDGMLDRFDVGFEILPGTASR
jgi:alkyl sulfatase BDS1-like metallo-beta-lactamase superfamily hydrolase